MTKIVFDLSPNWLNFFLNIPVFYNDVIMIYKALWVEMADFFWVNEWGKEGQEAA
jgi:hypothetical protein